MENEKELMVIVKELLLDGHSPADIAIMALKVSFQLQELTTGGNK